MACDVKACGRKHACTALDAKFWAIIPAYINLVVNLRGCHHTHMHNQILVMLETFFVGKGMESESLDSPATRSIGRAAGVT